MMMVAVATETCRWILIHMTNHVLSLCIRWFIHKYKYSLMHIYGGTNWK